MNKPTAQVLGEDGNVFNLIGICTKALKKAGQSEQAEKLREEVFSAASYEDALRIMAKYCELE